jgi:hypothetical protein
MFVDDKFIPHPGLPPSFSREEKEHHDFPRTSAVAPALLRGPDPYRII